MKGLVSNAIGLKAWNEHVKMGLLPKAFLLGLKKSSVSGSLSLERVRWDPERWSTDVISKPTKVE